jgi:alpha-glucosidase
LGEESFQAKTFSDAPDASENPNHLTERIFEVKKGDDLEINLAPGGGQVVIISPK